MHWLGPALALYVSRQKTKHTEVTCTFPITEYYAFEFNVETEKLKLHVFTIDKDHNVEHYILMTYLVTVICI